MWDLLDEWSRNAVVVAEQYADGEGTTDDLGFGEREQKTLNNAYETNDPNCRTYGIRAAAFALWQDPSSVRMRQMARQALDDGSAR
jgi:hypothetical protein